MNYKKIVTESLASLNLLDKGGKLVKLDSLGLIDLVVVLEEKASTKIPTAALRADNFETIETIVEMLTDLAD